MYQIICLLCLLILTGGCTLAELKVNVVSERTALENQVLGTYNSLTEEALLVASVRGVTPTGEIESRPEQSAAKHQAMESMQVLGFHQDDIQNFKTLGWIGENTRGLLTSFPRQTQEVPPDLADFAARYSQEEFISVIQEVNQARETIMQQVIQTNEQFTEQDLATIRQVFWRMHVEQALPGEKIQNEDGTWTNKS
jgi:uncharacterized protein YdbL (DUF1318 family)